MKIPYFCCIGAELKRYAKDFDFMNQVYLYKVPADDTMEEVLAQDYFQAVADTVLQDDIVYIYEPTTEMLYTCHFNKQNGHITAEQMSNNIPSLTPDKILISDATGHITAGDVSLDFVKNKLTDLENDKVNIDGSSTMTGPLKFKAGSFSGAIAGGLGDGISIYKLNSDGTIDSEVASLTKTNGFTPGTTNAQNIGSPTLKWKDAHLARVITAVLNNGYDIAVPVTNSADKLALKSEVDLAANSGRMITDQGVWYAKMYAETVAPSAENGTNYADFSQTDGQGDPIIVIYNRVNGAWVQDQTITPPTEYDGYVQITSKIWDIVEQTNQQGGRILWNHQSKEFTPYPNIVDLSNVATTDLDNLTPTGEAKFTAKANTDMDNLTSTGQNIANWSSNVSNCITNIPQDIKLELDNGTLTLKADSKLYVPNDAGVFDVVTIASDITVSAASGATKYMLFYNRTNSTVWFAELAYQHSGTTPSGDGFYYNTSTNKIVFLRSGVADPYEFSFPIGIVTSDSTKYTDINHVFNGFGYIGSTVFVLPGVKGLIPNGRNSDGTLKNNKITVNSVITRTYTDNNNTGIYVGITLSGTIELNGQRTYNVAENFIYNGSSLKQVCEFAYYTNPSGKIANFTPKTTFHAVDYSEADFVVLFQRPTAQNDYTWYRKYKSGWVEQGGQAHGSKTVNLPITMSDANYETIINVIYNNAGTAGFNELGYVSKTTTSFTKGGNANNFNWVVCGMAA